MGNIVYLVMFNLIVVLFSLALVGLTGWTVTTYFLKEGSKKSISEELTNLLDICKMFFESLKSLTGTLIKFSISTGSIEQKTLDEQPLKAVDLVEQIETTGMVPSMEEVEEDSALSSFSPELLEAITEEEEKVA